MPNTWEIIFVEDKSSDDTAFKVKELGNQIKESRVIYHRKNMGRGKTVSDGIISSRGKICGYLDADLEVSASYIPTFTREIEKGYDMVVGKRFYKASVNSIIRFLASKFYSVLVWVSLKLPIEDTEAGYKFFKRDKILPVLKMTHDNGWFWDTEICARAFWSGLKLGEIPILFVRRAEKKSTVRLIPDTLNYLIKIYKFSQKNR